MCKSNWNRSLWSKSTKFVDQNSRAWKRLAILFATLSKLENTWQINKRSKRMNARSQHLCTCLSSSNLLIFIGFIGVFYCSKLMGIFREESNWVLSFLHVLILDTRLIASSVWVLLRNRIGIEKLSFRPTNKLHEKQERKFMTIFEMPNNISRKCLQWLRMIERH